MSRVLLLVVVAGLSACRDEHFDLRPRAGIADGSTPDVSGPEPIPTPSDAVNCDPRSGDEPKLKLTAVATGLESPVYVTSLPGDASELYVVGRFGTIRVIVEAQLLEQPFLDLSDRVFTEYVERGLLGLAFHPNYAQNGRLFVYYVSRAMNGFADGNVVMAEFSRAPDDPLRAVSEPVHTLLQLHQVGKAHKSGMMIFDRGGLLFVGVGNASLEAASRETDTLLGKILRLDIDAEKRPYGIPPGNMEGPNVRPEIWDYGLRNPWRFSLDACTDDLYIGDVGDGTREEINVEPAGEGHRNYGYPAYQGDVCFKIELYNCEVEGDTKPLLVHTHDDGVCAVIGGFVYRGHNIPGLRGSYLYADHCTGRFWAFEYDGEAANHRELTADLNPNGIRRISSFGQDALGELYVASIATGSVYRIDPE